MQHAFIYDWSIDENKQLKNFKGGKYNFVNTQNTTHIPDLRPKLVFVQRLDRAAVILWRSGRWRRLLVSQRRCCSGTHVAVQHARSTARSGSAAC